jgi:hypothetical protein
MFRCAGFWPIRFNLFYRFSLRGFQQLCIVFCIRSGLPSPAERTVLQGQRFSHFLPGLVAALPNYFESNVVEQVDTLSVFHNLKEVEIACNPIVELLPKYRDYLIFRIPSIKRINSREILDADRSTANSLFDPLRSLWRNVSVRRIKGFCQPDMKMPIKKQHVPGKSSLIQELTSFDRPVQNLPCEPIREVLTRTRASLDNCKLVENAWPEMIGTLVNQTLT